jgi:hypothetical protein
LNSPDVICGKIQSIVHPSASLRVTAGIAGMVTGMVTGMVID